MSAILSYEQDRSRATGPLLALAGGADLAVRLRNGWVPWDEGRIAPVAERVVLPRARLRTSRADSAPYGELVRVIGAQGDRTLGYDGPDAPEVYLLTQSRTTDLVLFDFFSVESGSLLDDPEFLRESDLVVPNHRPGFSNPLRPSTLQRVASEFPFSATIGSFEVRWRE